MLCLSPCQIISSSLFDLFTACTSVQIGHARGR
jgi:hypothetical protein